MTSRPHNVTAQDIKTLMIRVYRRYQEGLISDQQALKETALLSSILRAIETSDLEHRLETITALMGRGQ
jgi:hypothetical protein